ncbi:MAG: hypothetical protein P4L55_07700 [Syntrophobacteraceae bacterium]|nr:hypothetical protein [Syntrophobacteraceae bacterium]
MIKKCAFVFWMFLLVTGCAGQYAGDPQSLWHRPEGVSPDQFQRDVAACRSVAIAIVPAGFKPFSVEGDPEQQWAQLQNDPMSYRALMKYEKCMQDKGYVLEDHDFHPSEMKDFLKSD